MNRYRHFTTLQDVIRTYVAGIQGILIDHVEDAVKMGARIVDSVEGRQYRYLVVDGTGRAYPILCGHIVPVETEDGPSDGRCGFRVDAADGGACGTHAAERDYWLSLTEAEKAAIEREEDAFA